MEEGRATQIWSDNRIKADIQRDTMESEGEYSHVHSVKLGPFCSVRAVRVHVRALASRR